MKFLITALLLLASWTFQGTALQAQEEAPRFLLERITVAGAREAAGRIVEAETLLREGGSYGEEDLAQAVARVQRLPFVLDADFSLRKGSERGAYELVIQVEEARRFFYEHSIRASFFDEPIDLDQTTANEFILSLPGLVGARQFVGRSGVVFAALDTVEGAQVGFTRYDLFGRGVVASVAWSGFFNSDVCCASEVLPYALDPSFVSWGWDESSRRLSVEAAVPLRPTDALRFSWSRRDGGGATRSEVFGVYRGGEFFVDAGNSDLTLDRAELKWVRDTSDDPLVPTRGHTLSGGIEWTAFETGPLRGFRRETGYIAEPLPPQQSELTAAVVSAARHWSLTPRQTVSGQGRLSAGRASLRQLPTATGVVADQDLDAFSGSLGLRHALRLKQSRGERGFSDLYLESTAEVGVETTSPDLRVSASTHNPLERLELSVGLVFRNAWGRLRFRLAYLDVGTVWR